MRHSVSFLHLLTAAALLVPVAGNATSLMSGKVETDRTVGCETTVEATPHEVYRLWTTEDGVKRFFAPDAHIEPWPGGRYEILFVPDRDPQGLSHGTTGARMLRLVPNRRLVFEWITFAGDSTLGNNAPPVAPPALRNERPLPTWVEVRLQSLPGGRTRVTLHHYGFRHGDLWDASYAFFDRAWRGVLQGLEEACRTSAGSGTVQKRTGRATLSARRP